MQWSLHVLPQVLDARVAGDIYRGPLQGPGTFAGALPVYREHCRDFFCRCRDTFPAIFTGAVNFTIDFFAGKGYRGNGCISIVAD